MSQSLQESLEAIAYQSTNAYPAKLKELFQKIIDSNGDLIITKQCLDNIQDLTLSVTGIRFEPEMVEPNFLRGPYRISAKVPNLNALNPINQNAQKRLEKLDLDTMNHSEILEGYIDLKNARVGGFFSKLVNVFQISPAFFSGYFTAGEVAALYLHELGHCFTMYEYIGETLITNVIIAEVVGRMDSQETLEKRLLVGKAALKLAGSNVEVRDDITSAEVTALVLDGQVQRMRRAAGTKWYDQRLAEAVADQFAARWGMGLDLAKALAKQERSTGIFAEAGYEPIWFGVLMNFINLTAMPFKKAGEAITTVLLKSLSKVAMSYSISMITGSMVFFLVSSRYSTIPQRTAALRREMVALLKDRKITDEFRRQVLAEIDELDKVLAEKHNWSDVYGKVGRYSLDTILGRNKELGAHELTEELANNRLYQLSAALKG